MRENINRYSIYLLKIIAFLLLFPIPVIISLRWINPPTSAYIFQHKISLYFNDKDPELIQQKWTSLENISPNLAIAVVASEDQKFPSHFGFDVESIEESISSNRKKIRGASTITQQVARNLFLWSGRSWIRKILEAYLTFLIEVFWSKHRIIEVYLNFAQFGKYTYGAAAASEYFYGISASKLNPAQAALFAAVLPNPVRFKIERPSSYILKRMVWIQTQVSGLGGKAYLKDIL